MFFCVIFYLCVINRLPYGDDDQDFDLNFLINRHYNVSKNMIFFICFKQQMSILQVEYLIVQV
jgi:hypothetical protein